jgi:urea carboxylase
VSWEDAVQLNDVPNKWLAEIKDLVAHPGPRAIGHSPYTLGLEDTPQSPLLHTEGQGKNQVAFRQVSFTFHVRFLTRI